VAPRPAGGGDGLALVGKAWAVTPAAVRAGVTPPRARRACRQRAAGGWPARRKCPRGNAGGARAGRRRV